VKGLAFSLASALALVLFGWRVAAEALEALLVAPAPVDLPGIWALAEEIRRRNAAELGGLTFVLLALWALSIFDAWRDASATARVL
jgi:hypothetical protein